jgi:hypothetical protein
MTSCDGQRVGASTFVRTTRALFSLAAVGALTVASTVFAGATSNPTPGTKTQVSALVAASIKIKTANATIIQELPAAPNDIADTVYKIPAVCTTSTACVYGDVTGTKSIVLFGNSHARMWLPSIIPVAITDGYKLILLGKNSCPVVTLNLSATVYPGCNAVVSASIAVINAVKPVAAILADRTAGSKYTLKQWQAGMTATIKAIQPSKANIVVIGDIQEFNSPPPECISVNLKAIQTKCAIPNPNPRQKLLAAAELAATKATKTTYLNPTSWLCTTKRCSPVIGNFIAYWGADHVSVTYARYLSTVMGLALAKPLA